MAGGSQIVEATATATRARLDAVRRWIGTPEGRGRIVPAAPALERAQSVRTMEADGALASRRVRLTRRLGSGLAGTVFAADDEAGDRFVEKHYGPVPADGSKRLGKFAAELLFSLFRQAAPSLRELPEAAVATHLTNRIVVATSIERYGFAITPPILYTRYDATTGGYVQAYPFVKGRPLRPCDNDLPLLGEGTLFLPTMRRWRDFLANDLGFWGLARQVDPANPNSFSNVWVTEDRHVLLLDIVPGLPGFLEPRYLWWGATRGQFPPFGDAIDFDRLTQYLSDHPTALPTWREDVELLKLCVQRWQDAEPRLCATPLRAVRCIVNRDLRQAQRESTLTHIEVKGAITAAQAYEYRQTLQHTGRFPRCYRHALLKMAPLPLHRALTDVRYLVHVLFSLPRYAWNGLAKIGGLVAAAARTAWTLVALVVTMLISRTKRLEWCHAEIGRWIDAEQELGRLTPQRAGRLRASLHESHIADIAGLFVLHILVGSAKQAVLGPSVLWLGAAAGTGKWWLAAPAVVSPVLRVLAAVWVGLWRKPEIVLFSALPTVGVFAAPMYLLRQKSEIGQIIIRGAAQRAALRIPGFGERGSLTELLAVATAQVFLIDLGRLLPVLTVLVLVSLLSERPLLAASCVLAYLIVVAIMIAKRWRHDAGDDRLSTWNWGFPTLSRTPPAPAPPAPAMDLGVNVARS